MATLTRELHTITGSVVVGIVGVGGGGSAGVVTEAARHYRRDEELLHDGPAGRLQPAQLLPVLGPDNAGGGAGVHQAAQSGREEGLGEGGGEGEVDSGLVCKQSEEIIELSGRANKVEV